MGKSKGKKGKKSEFDDFFQTHEKKSDDGGWQTGVTAMALDDEPGPSAAGAEAAKPAKKGKGGGGDTMDTTDGTRVKGSALGVQKVQMKAVRGQKTKAQKLRKIKKAEKATARADKTVVRVGTQVSIKQKKSSYKSIY